MMRVMEVLLHGGSQLCSWRTVDIHASVREAFCVSPQAYSLAQFRDDLRKMKAHGLLEREGRRYSYRLTDKGIASQRCSSCSTNVSAVPSLTRCFRSDPTNLLRCGTRSKRRTMKPMPRFKS